MKFSKLKIIISTLAVQILLLICISMVDMTSKSSSDEKIPTEIVVKRSFPIEIRSVGELEAARSTSISSSLRGDQAKIIQIVADGTNVQAGDLLVKIDSTPYEKTVDELIGRIKEYESHIEALKKALDWEITQAEHETKAAAFEMETAELELNKIIQGDGPLEASRLKSVMQKAKIKFDELNGYSQDLLDLESQGFLNPIEVRQAQKKLQEDREAYDAAKMQYESYVNHVYPMQIKKAETSIKRLINKQEETARAGGFKIAKAEAQLIQTQQELLDVKRQLQNARNELSLTEIKAPSPGMVVQREEYRNSQRRKPRVGDLLVKNQPILDLPDLNSMIVKTKVREIDLFKIENGKAATIEVDAYPNLLLEGKVTFIGILALSEGVRAGDEKYFEVKVGIDKSDPRLRPGMTARVVIHADYIAEALSVPIHAVFEYDKKHYCYVEQAHGRYLMQPISTGMNNEQWVAVKEGLKENVRICLAKPEEKDIIKVLPSSSEKGDADYKAPPPVIEKAETETQITPIINVQASTLNHNEGLKIFLQMLNEFMYGAFAAEPNPVTNLAAVENELPSNKSDGLKIYLQVLNDFMHEPYASIFNQPKLDTHVAAFENANNLSEGLKIFLQALSDFIHGVVYETTFNEPEFITNFAVVWNVSTSNQSAGLASL